MSKLAILFPGQGSQYLNMGAELFCTKVGTKVWEEGKRVLGAEFLRIMTDGPEEELNKTENTQPAVMLVSMAAYLLLKTELDKMNIEPEFMAGHSLGEYTAYVAAESMSLTEGLKLVQKRGKLMAEAVPYGSGGMAAVFGMEKEILQKLCREAQKLGKVEIANYNCPGQIVISGETAGVERVLFLAKEWGAKRVLKLNVSGPFHSSFMKSAGNALEKELRQLKLKTPRYPVYSNVDGMEVRDTERMIHTLVKQISSPVQWEKVIQNMVDQGADCFIECGPGKVLTGLVKKIAPSTIITHVEDLTSLEKSLAYLKESR